MNANDLDDIPAKGIQMSDGLTMKGDYQRIARHERKEKWYKHILQA